MSKKQLSTVKNPVRTVLTLHDDAAPDVSHTVYCKRRQALMDVETCRHCEKLVSMPEGPLGPHSALRCEPHSSEAAADEAPTTLGALAARTPLAEVLRRRVLCVQETASVEFLEGLLLEQHLDALPVVDDEEHLVGIVSKTDLLRASRDGDPPSNETTNELSDEPLRIDAPRTLTAGDLMTPVVHTAPIDAPLSHGIALLALEDVDQVPVLSAEGTVVGMLAMRDVVRWAAQEMGYVVRPPGL